MGTAFLGSRRYPREEVRKEEFRVKTSGSQTADRGIQVEETPTPEGKEAVLPGELPTSRLEGLAGVEARERLQDVGPNEILEKRVSPLRKLLSFFSGPIPWMIEVAAFLSAAIGRWEDFVIILVLLALNAGVGFWQEHKADNAISALKERLALTARVFRDGSWQTVPAREIVPDDLVRVRSGEIVPADLELLPDTFLEVDESALTGESLPVEKHGGDSAYSGSIARRGEANARVTATGMDTFFGKTAHLVDEARTESHFQRAVVKIGDYLIVLAVGLVLILFLVGLYRHESVLDTLRFALVLTVAAIPAALPAVLSVTMVVGASALAKRKAIVSRLVAIEEMAGMDVLCTDKTGTLTKNELAVARVVPNGAVSEATVLLHGWLASREENGDPIDDAVIRAARLQPEADPVRAGIEVEAFHPFDPVVKRTEATAVDAHGTSFTVAKGAPQVILALTGLARDSSDGWIEKVEELAEQGFRALAVATRPEGSEVFTLSGLLALMDPPREDSADTVRETEALGVAVKMVTGDHAAIARQVSRQVHLEEDIRDVSSFLGLPDRQASRAVEKASGFAQVFPEHKYHIVDLLQHRNHIVGMTGDGVNDAPALKKADAGIAVAGATDAARAAADIILTDPGLSVITEAIAQSRRVFARMNSYAIYRITETIRVLFFITLSILVFDFYPVTAVMIVLLALLNDAPIMTIAYDNADFSKTPVRWNMRTVLGISTLLGMVGVASSFGIFYLGKEVLHLSRDMLQSFVFLKLAVAGHLTIFLTRTRGPFWSNRPSMLLLVSAVTTKVLATLVVAYGWFVAPLGWRLTGYVWLYALLAFVVTDLVKVRFYRVLEHESIRFSR